MDNKFTQIMTKYSDAELLKIVNGQRDDYQPEAVEAAEKELANRNLSGERLEKQNLRIYW